MAKLYVVSLSDAERLLLQSTIRKGTAPARTITRARILLRADREREGVPVSYELVRRTLKKTDCPLT